MSDGITLFAVKDQTSKHDWILIGSGLLLAAIGMLAINSVDMAVAAKAGRAGGFAVKQAILGAISILAMLGMSRISGEVWQRLSKPIWIINLLLLLVVQFAGTEKNNAQRWISVGSFTFQPSDFTKVFIVITLASFFMAHWEDERDWKFVGKSFLHVLPTIVLLLLQPHYGGAACILVIWLAICLYGGVSAKKLRFILGGFLSFIVILALVPGMFDTVFKSYHAKRISEKVNSIFFGKSDPRGAGYQQKQSEIAFALGGITGQGYGRGERKAARFIPEQQSDFILSVIGEELGFVGTVLTIFAFLFFFYRVWLVGYRTRDPMGQMVSAGVFAVLAFHTIVNFSMVLNIGLTIGLWLPFLSAGGTALLTCFMLVGLLDGVR